MRASIPAPLKTRWEHRNHSRYSWMSNVSKFVQNIIYLRFLLYFIVIRIDMLEMNICQMSNLSCIRVTANVICIRYLYLLVVFRSHFGAFVR